MNNFSHGGEREGAGQKPKWHSGATVTIRLPQVLVEDILRYARLIDGQFPNGLQVESSLSCNLETVTESRKFRGRLESVTTERDRLDSECNELAARVGDLNLQLETTQQILQEEIDLLRSEIVLLKSQSDEVSKLLKLTITSQKEGGIYKANNATGMKEPIQQALSLLATPTTSSQHV